LATRLEQANRTAGAAQSSSRRPDGKSHAERNQTRSSSKRPRTGSHTEPRERSDRAPQSGRTEGAAEVTCYGCNEKGHYKSNCPHPDKWSDSRKTSTRKAAAGAPQSKSKDKKEQKKPKKQRKHDSSDDVIASVKLIRREARSHGVDTSPAQHLRGDCVLPAGRTLPADCMLDDAADVNVVSQAYAVKCGWSKIPVPLPRMEAFRGEQGHCYGAYRVRLRIADSSHGERLTEGTFYGADLEGVDVLLGRPWRRKYGVVVDSRTDSWWFANEGEAHPVRLRDARAFARDMRSGSQVWAVLTAPENKDLPAEIRDYSDVFVDSTVVDRPRPEGVEHAIDLEPGRRPPFRPLYNLSVTELKVLREYLAEAEKNGWRRRSESEAGAPILFQPKKDGSLRLVLITEG